MPPAPPREVALIGLKRSHPVLEDADALFERLQPALSFLDVLKKPVDPAHQADDCPDAGKGQCSALPRLAQFEVLQESILTRRQSIHLGVELLSP
jgi:hypothetical protein